MIVEGLLPSQVEELGREVHRAGFDPRTFKSGETDHQVAGYSSSPALFYKSDAVFFAFARYYRQYGYSGQREDLGHAVGFAPGVVRPFEERGPLTWPDVVSAFRDWLQSIQRESSVADAWSMPPGTAGLGATSPHDDEPFALVEQKALREQLDRIEELLVKSVGDQKGAADQIRREIAELRAEVAKMQRGKWKKFAVGTLASLTVREVVTPERVQQAFGILRQFFDDTIQLLGR